LEKRLETVDDTQLDVFGIQRVMRPLDDDPVEWHSYYSAEGFDEALHCFSIVSIVVAVVPGGGDDVLLFSVLIINAVALAYIRKSEPSCFAADVSFLFFSAYLLSFFSANRRENLPEMCVI